MAIVYCSWATGDDTTGDGTAANPFKTITKATAGLTGGDEVRVAKSPDPTALTGTVNFTSQSTAITGIDTLFTSELAIGDFIEGPYGYWWEVVSIISNTSATLYRIYSGESGSCALRKLGVTSTGAPAANTTAVQSVSSSGTSNANLKISGGWDLSTQTKTGQTWFMQLHGTFANRYGYGLHSGIGRSYIEIENIRFLRYYNGLYIYSSSTYWYVNNVICLSCSYRGVNITSYCSFCVFNNVISNSNGGGILISSVSDITITNSVFNGNSDGIGNSGYVSRITITDVTCNSSTNSLGTGISFNSGKYITLTRVTCNLNSAYGINFSANSSLNKIIDSVCNFNSNAGILIDSSFGNTIKNCTCNSNGSGIYFSRASRNIIIGLTCNLNTYYGARFRYECYENVIYSFRTMGNLGGPSIYGEIGLNYFIKTILSESIKVTLSDAAYSSSYYYITDINDYASIWTDGGNIVSQAATAGGTGKEWKFSPTDASRHILYPLKMEVAKVACTANSLVTVTLYFKKSGTGVAGALFMLGGQIAGVDNDISVDCPDDTNRNQVTLQFTPTEAGVVKIEALAWYVSATNQNVIIDDIEISQA